VIGRQHLGCVSGPQELKITGTTAQRILRLRRIQKRTAGDSAQDGEGYPQLGDSDKAFPTENVFEADYYVPLLAHAPMEPMVALAEFQRRKVTAWAQPRILRRRRQLSPPNSALRRRLFATSHCWAAIREKVQT